MQLVAALLLLPSALETQRTAAALVPQRSAAAAQGEVTYGCQRGCGVARPSAWWPAEQVALSAAMGLLAAKDGTKGFSKLHVPSLTWSSDLDEGRSGYCSAIL